MLYNLGLGGLLLLAKFFLSICGLVRHEDLFKFAYSRLFCRDVGSIKAIIMVWKLKLSHFCGLKHFRLYVW